MAFHNGRAETYIVSANVLTNQEHWKKYEERETGSARERQAVREREFRSNFFARRV